MDAFVLARLSAVLQESWAGAWIQGVWEDTTGRLVLKLRHRGRDGLLLISADRSAPGLGLIGARPPCPPRPTALAAYLRAHARGTVLSAACVPYQRIVELELGSTHERCTVVLEALPGNARILAVDAGGVVRAAGRGGPHGATGRSYRRPELPPGCVLPSQVSAAEVVGWGQPGPVAPARVLGLGKELRAEVVHRSNRGEAETAWRSVLAECAGSGPLWVYSDGIYATELTCRGDAAGVRRDDCLEAAGERLLGPAGVAGVLDGKAAASKEAKRWRRRLERRVANIRAELDDLPDASVTRARAEALGTVLWRVQTGQTKVIVPDPRDPESEIVIPLDPALPPGKNLDGLYRQARKQQRSRVILAERLAAAEKALRDGPPAEQEGVRIANASPVSEKGTGPFRRYRSSDGWPIRVGRNGRENDRLVREAKPWDLWLHVRDASGAHVVICKPGREARVPERTLIEAAGLAAQFSNRSAEGSVEVRVAEVARLRKPKGAAPGQVLVAGDRSVRVTPGAGQPRRVE